MAEETQKEQIEKLERTLWRATPADDEMIEKIVSSPFLYAKIRARVEEAQAMPVAAPSYYSLLAMLARRAIPAFALLAVLAVAAYFFTSKNTPPPAVSMNDAVFVKVEKNTPPTACNIANRSECVVSTDDVVAILVHTSNSSNR